MKTITAHYVLVAAGESATREIMAELSSSHYSSIPEMSKGVEDLLGDLPRKLLVYLSCGILP